VGYFLAVLSLASIQALLGLSVFVVTLTRQVSFGQQGFYAIGAYTAAIATVVWGWNVVPALALGALVAALVGVVVGIPVLRVRGLYLAVATLAFAEIVRNLIPNFQYSKVVEGTRVGALGLEGFRGIRYFYDRGLDPTAVFGVIGVTLALVVAFLWRLDRSRTGRMFRAIGEDEHAAAMVGINVVAMKVLAFSAGGAVAGLAGGLYAHYTTFIEYGTFRFQVGVLAVAYALVGGTASVTGPLVGVAFFTAITEGLRPLGAYRLFAYGALIVVAMLARPFGIVDQALLVRLRRWFHPADHGGGPLAEEAGRAAMPRAARAPIPGNPTSSSRRPMLRVEDLTKHFAGVRALDGVDLAVEQGEIVGLIGPNGSGKTTLINVVTGAFPATAGRILFAGRDISGLSTNRRVALGIGRTFQNVRLWPRLTVWEHLWIAQRREGGPGDRRRRDHRARLAELIGFAALEDRRNDLAGSLSLGEQRRLELARALATEPSVLLLDEPVAGLTADEISAFLARLAVMRSEGAAILLVEHNMDVLMGMADRVVVLNFGRKIADGPPGAVQHDAPVQEAYLGRSRGRDG
jgi:branched-chain amino acid transport system permease protein